MKIKLKKSQNLILGVIAAVAVLCLGLLIPAVQNLAISFAEKIILHRELRKPEKWIVYMEKAGVQGFGFFLAIDICAFLVVSGLHKFLWKKINDVLEIFKNWFQPVFEDIAGKINKAKVENEYLLKVFFTFIVLYGLSFSAIIRANFYYIDDLGRSISGYQGWDNFSRYGSNFFSTLIHTGKRLSDISPLTQFIAVLVLSVASTILIHAFYSKKTYSFFACFSVLPLGISPYFLEYISYKFDSPYMALSILFMVVPLLFCKIETRKLCIVYAALVVTCVILTCITYQAALGIFPVAIIFIAAKRWNSSEDIKKILKFVFISAASYIVGVLIFRFLIMNSVDTYVSSKVFGLKKLPQGCVFNLRRYYHLVKTDFRQIWKIFIATIGLCYIALSVFHSKNSKLFAFLVSSIVLFLSFIFAFGLYILLEKPLNAPRAMYGFGVMLAFISIQCFDMDKICIARFAAISLSWCFVSFAFDYGNALCEQKNWTDFRVAMVINDLNEILCDDNKRVLQISGSIGKSKTIRNRRQDFAMMDRLVPATFDGSGWMWSQYYIRYYFDLNLSQDIGVGLTNMNLPLLKETMYHSIFGNNEYILVELK